MRKFWNIVFYFLNISACVVFLFFVTLPQASAMRVKLAWNNNKENDLAGYKIYCDINPIIEKDFCINSFFEFKYNPNITITTKECPFWIDLPICAMQIDGNNPTFHLDLEAPNNSQVYYFVVSAYDMQGLESLPSNAVNTAAFFDSSSYDKDDCLNDPDKTKPGICGCGIPDTDTDGDGTSDCKDGCPDDAVKIAPGVCGCGVSENDADTDGTPDCIDNCPNNPDKREPGICGCGVPDEGPEGCEFVDLDKISAFEMGIQGITVVVYDEPRNFLWVGTNEGELFAFDLHIQKLQGNYTANIGLNGDSIISMRMNNGYLLIETALNGEIKFNPETNGNRPKETGIYSDTETEEGFGMDLDDVISEIEEVFGMNLGDFISEIEERLSINLEYFEILEYSEINAIHIAGDCNVFKYWLVTNLGIVAVNEDFFIMHITSENSDLVDNRVYCMVEDVTGNLWFGTQIGLYKADFSMPGVTDFYPITNTDSDYDTDYVDLMGPIKINFSEASKWSNSFNLNRVNPVSINFNDVNAQWSFFFDQLGFNTQSINIYRCTSSNINGNITTNGNNYNDHGYTDYMNFQNFGLQFSDLPFYYLFREFWDCHFCLF